VFYFNRYLMVIAGGGEMVSLENVIKIGYLIRGN
jgi:hypothetical protein